MSTHVYLHGFASSPESAKAVLFRERLAERGVALNVPDLNEPDFEGLTLSRAMDAAWSFVSGDEKVVLIGSSFGGYTAALLATRHPEQVGRLVLMAPAFNMAQLLLDRYGEAAVADWQRTGQATVEHSGLPGGRGQLAWAFQEDAAGHAKTELAVVCPTLVFHGEADEDVPIAGTEAFVANHPNAELVRYQTGHRLEDVVEDIWTRSAEFLNLAP